VLQGVAEDNGIRLQVKHAVAEGQHVENQLQLVKLCRNAPYVRLQSVIPDVDKIHQSPS
jgi:hypothetical protein